MKKFTKLFLAFALCLVALVANAKTEKVYATFEAPANTNTTWNAETKTFTWATTYYNQLRNIGLPNGDISKYKKLVVDCDIVSGEQFRILFYKGGSNLTLYVTKSGVNEFIIADTLKSIAPNDYNEYMLACDEICLSGNNVVAPGEVKINEVYLETYDDEGEKTFATFEAPANTNTTWNAETKTFTWATTYYNQLRNIGLPNGDISKYKKLVVDCDIVSGEQFRILFYKGGSNLTLYVTKSGVNEFIIADTLKSIAPNDYNEYMLACDEICLSGNNVVAPGEVKINSVYLETYPENESVDIPEIEVEEAPAKPEGYIDLVASMYHEWTGTGADATETATAVSPVINLGKKIGNGEMVYGVKNKAQFADLSSYKQLVVVATPGLKLVLNLNHDVDVKENLGDYAEGESYVWVDAVVGEDGKYTLDLTQYPYAHLNNIRLPWDNNNKGTVWYLLLSGEVTDEPGDEPGEEPAGDEVLLTTDIFHKWTTAGADATIAEEVVNAENNIGKELGAGGMLYGLSTVDYLHYADLSDYDKIVFEGTAGVQLRVLMNRVEHEGALTEVNPTIGEDGKAEVDLTTYEFVHLNAIKYGWGSATGTITKVALVKNGISTDINKVESQILNNVYFDLQGRKVQNPSRGLYIVNGKKVVVR